MSIRRIGAILLQEFYITKRSIEVLIDLFFFSTITVIVFGFVSLFLTGTIKSASALYLILGMILWEVIRVNQYSISVGALWNIWSRNLSNLFVAPLTLREYIFALMLSAVLKGGLVFAIVSLIAALAFNFNILSLGIGNLIIFFINLTIFSWTIGLLLLGLIFVYGTRIQALAWGSIFLFQPLSASFFPASFLPNYLQPIAFLIPATHVFEAARAALTNSSINWNLFTISFVENAIYFILALIIFNWMFSFSKKTGQFARNEG